MQKDRENLLPAFYQSYCLCLSCILEVFPPVTFAAIHNVIRRNTIQRNFIQCLSFEQHRQSRAYKFAQSTVNAGYLAQYYGYKERTGSLGDLFQLKTLFIDSVAYLRLNGLESILSLSLHFVPSLWFHLRGSNFIYPLRVFG